MSWMVVTDRPDGSRSYTGTFRREELAVREQEARTEAWPDVTVTVVDVHSADKAFLRDVSRYNRHCLANAHDSIRYYPKGKP